MQFVDQFLEVRQVDGLRGVHVCHREGGALPTRVRGERAEALAGRLSARRAAAASTCGFGDAAHLPSLTKRAPSRAAAGLLAGSPRAASSPCGMRVDKKTSLSTSTT